ncbi:MAG TPA: hypothetical protein VFX16_35120 [Pseudonocardiaceae bacterium]|nr:hypothetical protein [Pseudonocardiaceae bacterium]
MAANQDLLELRELRLGADHPTEHLAAAVDDICHPNPMRRVEFGTCPRPGCDRTVFATVRVASAFHPPQVSCEAGHVWPARR